MIPDNIPWEHLRLACMSGDTPGLDSARAYVRTWLEQQATQEAKAVIIAKSIPWIDLNDVLSGRTTPKRWGEAHANVKAWLALYSPQPPPDE